MNYILTQQHLIVRIGFINNALINQNNTLPFIYHLIDSNLCCLISRFLINGYKIPVATPFAF